jgi:DNA-binding response OmpR family regulator
MPPKVLIVDDNIRDSSDEVSKLPSLLESTGYEAIACEDGNEAYDLMWDDNPPDIVVLDVALGIPGFDGIDFCRLVRQGGCRVPIILITAWQTKTEDVLRGFDAGADDYVVRPRDMREVVARVRANLPPQALVIDDYIRIDGDARRIWINTQGQWTSVHLQPLQFEFILTLVMNLDITVPLATIKERVWGKPVEDGVVHVTVHRVREKLEPDLNNPCYIENVSGVGYRFNARSSRLSLSPVSPAP